MSNIFTAASLALLLSAGAALAQSPRMLIAPVAHPATQHSAMSAAVSFDTQGASLGQAHRIHVAGK